MLFRWQVRSFVGKLHLTALPLCLLRAVAVVVAVVVVAVAVAVVVVAVWMTFQSYNFSVVVVFAAIYSKTVATGQLSLPKSYRNWPYIFFRVLLNSIYGAAAVAAAAAKTKTTTMTTSSVPCWHFF